MATHDHRLQKIRDHVQDAHEALHALPAEDRQAFESDLTGLNDIVAHARAVLAAADPRLVSTRAFASIKSAACAISDDPRGALEAPDAHVDALANALALLPVTRKEMEHQVAATAEHFHESTADGIRALHREIEAEAKRVRGLASDIGKSRSRLETQVKKQAALDKKLAKAEETLARQAAAVDERMGAQSETVAQSEGARTAELQTQLDALRADLAHAQQEAIDAVQARVAEQVEKQAALDKKLAEAEETLARQAAAVEERMGAQSETVAESEGARTAEFQTQLDSFRADLARAQQEAIDEVQARVAEQVEKQAALDKSLAEAEETLARHAAAVDEHMGAQSEAFAESETARTVEFQTQLDSFRADLARAQQEAIAEVQARVAEIRRMEQETADLVGAIGLQGTGEVYRRRGRWERRAAEILRGLAVLAGLGAVAIALTGAIVRDPTAESLVAGLFASLLLAGLAAYLGLQAGRHRAREERATALELELAAFGPFIEPLSPEQREEERVIMARKLFPAPEGNGAPVRLALRRSRENAGLGASNEVPGRWSLGLTPRSAPAEAARAPTANGAPSTGRTL